MKRILIYSGIVLALSLPFANAKENLRELFKNNEAIIYTINIRNFASIDKDLNGIIEVEKGDKTGNFVNAKTKLKELAQQGINTIYVLPITPTGKLKALGTAGSLYAMDDFNKIAPELDDLTNDKTIEEEAKDFIKEAHRLNLNVIIDLPSCGSYDLTLKRPEWFILNEKKEPLIPADWTDVRLFKIHNEDNNLNEATLNNFKSFVDMSIELGFDGIRADVAAIKPPKFWQEIIKHARKQNKDFYFLAEANVEWNNPAPNGVSHYSSVDELLEAGFDSYYASWSDFKNIKTKEEFDNKIVKNQKILEKNKGKSHISAFATHDQQAPILRGLNYWNMVLWLNATLPSNMYFLDGFNTGDDFTYSYEGKKATKTYTDDEYYFVHSGMLDIFNFSTPAKTKYPRLKGKYVRAIDFRKRNQELIAEGKFSLLKTGNEKVFSYSIINKDKELIVIGSLDESKEQKASVKSKYLEKDNLFSLINTKRHPQLNQDMIEATLEPLELQVYMINLANSQAN
ncbi:MAG: hypothetical protein IJB79_05010 [Candidatus Gastranaerophilales bacterium]|nr:hypothetical protein [Candidatus Gastranaerophilales bacterium]